MARLLWPSNSVYKSTCITRITATDAISKPAIAKLSEYHTGYRAFNGRVLKDLPLLENSDDFVFDNQILAQCVMFGFRMGEVSCPTKYFPEASSINFRRSVQYGLGVLLTSVQFRLQKLGLARFRIFSSKGRRLEPGTGTYYARGAA